MALSSLMYVFNLSRRFFSPAFLSGREGYIREKERAKEGGLIGREKYNHDYNMPS